MCLISTQGYTNANVHHLKIRTTDEIWVIMKDIGDGLGVTNIYDLVWKEIYGIYEKRKLTKEETKNYKTTEREIFEKFDNLGNDKLNTKSGKFVYVKNNVMTLLLSDNVDVRKKEEEEQ